MRDIVPDEQRSGGPKARRCAALARGNRGPRFAPLLPSKLP